MSSYSLIRADLDAICELTNWDRSDREQDPLHGVSSKVSITHDACF